jgi:hypothetical protein
MSVTNQRKIDDGVVIYDSGCDLDRRLAPNGRLWDGACE